MQRVFPSLCLLALLLISCSAASSSTSTPSPTTHPSAIMTPNPSPFKILAYATGSIVESDIPYDKLTHINYAFLIPNPDGTFQSFEDGSKLEQIVAHAHAKNVKVMISVGGWGWDPQFETLAAHPESRTAFVQNLKSFVNQYQLDGADIDWEYPDPGQSSQNFLALMQELRAAMPNQLLTMAVISYGDEFGLGIPDESFALVDFVNIMTYDGPDHGTMEQFQKGLDYWSGRGLPKDKTVMGVPFYARVKDTRAEGPTFAQLVQADPAAAKVDEFVYEGKPVVYNGIPTIQRKTHIALERASGIMFWALDHDSQGGLSLVNAIYHVVHES